MPACHDGFRRTDLQPGVEGAEACDDGNTDEDDGCVGNCQQARCGDELIRSDLSQGERGFEACDDGDDSDPHDGCHRCKTPGCGDGVVQDNEACDDGNILDDDACTNDCVEARCGDGIRRLGTDGEACDDGNTDNTDACTNQCTLAACGDGFVQAGEACDDGNLRATDACTDACVEAVCGDGITRSDLAEAHDDGEGCDDADDDDNDACTNNCKRARCGDGEVRRHFEACDDGNEDPGDACVNCRLATCGNGQIDGDEECDDGNEDNEDGCTHLCLFARCGDGFQRGDLQLSEPGAEACDDGNERDDDFCLNNCARNVCGDGVLRRDREPGQDGYESCDDGNDIDDDGCTNNCLNGCGDGRRDEGEACDDGNFIDGDDCTNSCTIATCGDGVTRDHDPEAPGYETCDDGDDDDNDACTTQCRTARCGDGIIRTDLVDDQSGYENCEDEDDDVPTDGCHQCRMPRCGDGIVRTDLTGDDPGHENCDDGDDLNNNGCRNDCQWGVCGDGVQRTDQDGFEVCDDGNSEDGDGCRGDCSQIEAVNLQLNEDISCAVFGDRRARCWGKMNMEAQRTLSEQRNVKYVGHTHGHAGFLELAHTCVVQLDGHAKCWGKILNDARPPDDESLIPKLFGRPKDPGSEGRYGRFDQPMVMTDEEGRPLFGLIELKTHTGSFCARNAQGHLWCWGRLPTSTGPHASRINIGDPVAQIAMGATKACVRTHGAGLVFCWGVDANRGWVAEREPTHIQGTIGANYLGMGNEYGCFLTAEGVGCWGYSAFKELPAQIGDRGGCLGNSGRLYPVSYRAWRQGEAPWVALVGSTRTTLGITDQGDLRLYGVPIGGGCSGGWQPPNESQSVILPDQATALQVAMGDRHACVRTTIGSVYCWGANQEGQAGLGTQTLNEPTLIIP